MLALLVVLLHISLSRLDNLSASLDSITHQTMVINRLIGTMHEGIRLRQISLRNILLMPDLFDRDEESLRFYSYAVPVSDSRNKLVALSLNTDERKVINRISALMKIAYPIQNDLVDDALEDTKVTGLGNKLNFAIKSQNEVVVELKKLSQVHEKRSINAILETEYLLQESRNLVNTLGIAAFILGGFIAFIVIRIVRNQDKAIDKAMNELQEANNQLEGANENLETKVKKRTNDLAIARDHALNLNRTKSQFVANMTHELRTPLNAIIGYTEMLREDISELSLPNVSNDLENVYTASKQLLGLVDQVLDLSRVESGRLEIMPRQLELSTFLDSIYRIALPSIIVNGNKLNVNYPDDIGSMNVDPMRLRQVLLNLLNNAGKFTEDGEISLNVSTLNRGNENWIAFSVRDTGIGIDPNLFEKIFQEFTQADDSTTRYYGGTGLGLTITQQLCILMGGYISVDSKPGDGATFVVSLPVDNSSSSAVIVS